MTGGWTRKNSSYIAFSDQHHIQKTSRYFPLVWWLPIALLPPLIAFKYACYYDLVSLSAWEEQGLAVLYLLEI
jgi:hypothetical protein